MSPINKKEKRNQMIQTLKEISLSEKGRRAQAIYQELFASQTWQAARSIGVIISSEIEFPTAPIINEAFLTQKKVAVPKSMPGRRLVFHWINQNTAFYTSKFGVQEPDTENEAIKEQIDLLIVPGLVFSHQGKRIGFGGGFYDRYLVDYQGETVSLLYREQLSDDWQAAEYDIPVKQLFIAE
ncbi:5-formyltetrahydrofolate cyclo-ligase [Enterococcus alishanensis]|uniref:5-formyltetrahydrofolate cyclo-ligase n=1 Tax=Enterococcus alishanensis TaxID=1303817 RepID=A0ABS6TAK1_9ENTE|nr:5-formyltetrahydrofolate cyclo-ligase [Enterococcus alishanensis]MBV7389936.1 5-formyltetrahydrofolate cyclo-ligase [Enterococcus alishanensis]